MDPPPYYLAATVASRPLLLGFIRRRSWFSARCRRGTGGTRHYYQPGRDNRDEDEALSRCTPRLDHSGRGRRQQEPRLSRRYIPPPERCHSQPPWSRAMFPVWNANERHTSFNCEGHWRENAGDGEAEPCPRAGPGPGIASSQKYPASTVLASWPCEATGRAILEALISQEGARSQRRPRTATKKTWCDSNPNRLFYMAPRSIRQSETLCIEAFLYSPMTVPYAPRCKEFHDRRGDFKDMRHRSPRLCRPFLEMKKKGEKGVNKY
ncbi:hypothetical protein QBC33DRAFT_250620 [Phialemonium atrogriseum]|uniref:Uncharacterized protein n=1 Tax=Phialemonium atrogriseum TaxID=1093897 RepID=A0AAJ0BU84_9PEZI|nr:uncharacterized protein QBC33DRAFT_250620 [Phialemonium atrogriseum]KAK1763147.1 hypothetical protein QBC33DRAFT_250620 [Phialemonium atrogriseum]